MLLAGHAVLQVLGRRHGRGRRNDALGLLINIQSFTYVINENMKSFAFSFLMKWGVLGEGVVCERRDGECPRGNTSNLLGASVQQTIVQQGAVAHVVIKVFR